MKHQVQLYFSGACAALSLLQVSTHKLYKGFCDSPFRMRISFCTKKKAVFYSIFPVIGLPVPIYTSW